MNSSGNIHFHSRMLNSSSPMMGPFHLLPHVTCHSLNSESPDVIVQTVQQQQQQQTDPAVLSALSKIRRFTVMFEWHDSVQYFIRFFVFRNRLYVKGLDTAAMLPDYWYSITGNAGDLKYLPKDTILFEDFHKKLLTSDLERAGVLGKLLSELQMASLFPPPYRKKSIKLIELTPGRDQTPRNQDGVVSKSRAIEMAAAQDQLIPYTCHLLHFKEKRFDHDLCQKVFSEIVKQQQQPHDSLTEADKQMFELLKMWMYRFEPKICFDTKSLMEKLSQRLEDLHEDYESENESTKVILRQKKAEIYKLITNYMLELSKTMQKVQLSSHGGMTVLIFCFYVRKIMTVIKYEPDEYTKHLYSLFERYFVNDGILDAMTTYFGSSDTSTR